MLNRRTSLTLTLALAAILGAQVAAADAPAAPPAPAPAGVAAPAAVAAPVVGKFTSYKDHVLEIKVGKEKKDTKTFTLTDATAITLDGAAIKATELKMGETLTVTTDATGAVTSVAAAKGEKKAKKKKQ